MRFVRRGQLIGLLKSGETPCFDDLTFTSGFEVCFPSELGNLVVGTSKEEHEHCGDLRGSRG